MNPAASRRTRASWRRYALFGALAATVVGPQPAAAHGRSGREQLLEVGELALE